MLIYQDRERCTPRLAYVNIKRLRFIFYSILFKSEPRENVRVS